MLKAVFFDMYETLISLYKSNPYFGGHISQDIGVNEKLFRSVWDSSETDRTTGKCTTAQIVERIMRENGVYSAALLDKVMQKRVASKERCFSTMNEQIIPMLESLKARGLKLGVISNCFSEEAEVIRQSKLAPYFDVLCLSFELGVCKPDRRIFEIALDGMSRALGEKLLPEECLYVGDGGSNELEAARAFGMNAVQAVWYINEVTEMILPGIEKHLSEIRKDFPQAATPMEINAFA